jgi:all-trans-8'-apo-beta-carotenal 15,15'-oxygenase
MLEPPSNVSVYRVGHRLLAFGEQTLPLELDPATLETFGEFDFHGKLNDVSPFAAHAKFDPATGHMFNFGVTFAATKPTLTLYEFDGQAHLLKRSRYPIELPHSNHDFGISSNHAVFFLSPLIMDFGKFFQHGVSVMEALRWEPERGSYLLIVPRAQRTGKAVQPMRVAAGNGYCLHLINCFEQDEILTADILELDAPVYGEYQPIPNLFPTVAPCRPVRFRVDLQTGKLLERQAMAYDRTPDFPAVDPTRAGAAYSDFWMLGISEAGKPGRKFFNQLARGEWKQGQVTQIYQVGRGEYLGGEPVFAGNPGNPHEGVVIVEHFDTNEGRCEFLLFDAFDVQEGPIARLPLRKPIHPGFHASYYCG